MDGVILLRSIIRYRSTTTTPPKKKKKKKTNCCLCPLTTILILNFCLKELRRRRNLQQQHTRLIYTKGNKQKLEKKKIKFYSFIFIFIFFFWLVGWFGGGDFIFTERLKRNRKKRILGFSFFLIGKRPFTN